MKRFTKESYCDVRGWTQELIEKAAEMFSEDVGAPIRQVCYGSAAAVTDYHYCLVFNVNFNNIGVYGKGLVRGGHQKITREEVEQMIAERNLSQTDMENPMKTSTFERAISAGQDLQDAWERYQECIEELQAEGKGKFDVKPSMKLVTIDENVSNEAERITEGVDVDDPETWQKGDIIQCIDNRGSGYFTTGKCYTFNEVDVFEDVYVNEDDVGDRYYLGKKCFKFISRP